MMNFFLCSFTFSKVLSRDEGFQPLQIHRASGHQPRLRLAGADRPRGPAAPPPLLNDSPFFRGGGGALSRRRRFTAVADSSSIGAPVETSPRGGYRPLGPTAPPHLLTHGHRLSRFGWGLSFDVSAHHNPGAYRRARMCQAASSPCSTEKNRPVCAWLRALLDTSCARRSRRVAGDGGRTPSGGGLQDRDGAAFAVLRVGFGFYATSESRAP